MVTPTAITEVFEYFLYTRNYSKCFTYTNSYNNVIANKAKKCCYLTRR